MKAHLLFESADLDLAREGSPTEDEVIRDLDLPTVIEAMAAGDALIGAVARRVLLSSVADTGTIRYRQRILADCLATPEVVREMYGIAVEAVRRERRIYQPLRSHASGVLRRANEVLEMFAEQLGRLRALAARHGPSFESTGLAGLCSMLLAELDDDYFEEIGRHLRRLRLREGVLVSARLGTANLAEGYVLRAGPAPRRGLKERIGLGPRTSHSFEVPVRDEAGCRALSELTDRGVDLAANALAQSAEHIRGFLAMLAGELAFYVGCCNLAERLAALGVGSCTPDPEPHGRAVLAFNELRDVGLALRLGSSVVGNDVKAEGRSLVMVTGANSGGKSTFLRSVGQAQLMLQCGLFVCADSFASSLCDRVLTHFTREEDATMVSGKLDEELSRLSAVAEATTGRSMVLFNESFAATNEREGSEIGRQVILALRETGARVLFVTHMYDLASSLYQEDDETTLFLRAERGPGGERPFKLVEAGPLATSHGSDLFERLGGWGGTAGAVSSADGPGQRSEEGRPS